MNGRFAYFIGRMGTKLLYILVNFLRIRFCAIGFFRSCGPGIDRASHQDVYLLGVEEASHALFLVSVMGRGQSRHAKLLMG